MYDQSSWEELYLKCLYSCNQKEKKQVNAQKSWQPGALLDACQMSRKSEQQQQQQHEAALSIYAFDRPPRHAHRDPLSTPTILSQCRA